MTGTLLLALSTLAASTDSVTASPIPQAERSVFQSALAGELPIVRGQSPVAGPTLGIPEPVTSYYQTPTYSDPNAIGSPYMDQPIYGQPLTTDPFLGGSAVPFNQGLAPVTPYGAAPYGSPYPGTAPGMYGVGLNGPQPYRFGWTERHNVGFIADAGTNVGGDFGIFEYDYFKEYVTPFGPNWIFSIEPQYSLRLYDGPRVVRTGPGAGSEPAASEMPSEVHRFGLGMKAAAPLGPNWTLEGGFNPAIGTDMEGSLTSDAWMFDAHLAAFIQASPEWMWVLGAAYWDRVDDMVIPYAGAVWTPNDYVELRLLFPKPRISFFLGTPYGIPTWFYVQGEYHVEAYQMDVQGDQRVNGIMTSAGTVRVQVEDWRVVGGLYAEGAWLTGFAEAGVALNRDIKYNGPVRPFEADSAFLFRMGIRY